MSQQLLRDWASSSPAAYHRWVWRHHVAFPELYHPTLRFAPGAMDQARVEFFEDLTGCLRERGVDPATVTSVLEVGSSLGYLLRYVEQHVFPAAAVLDGVDISAYAVDAGNAALRRRHSRVQLHHLDAVDLDAFLDGRTYDVVYCAGMLMYLDEQEAAKLVTTMLTAANVAIGITGVAHPLQDNARMSGHSIREWDAAFIHNLDAMVLDAGGSILLRRWDGPRIVDGLSVYHLVAARERPTNRANDEPGSSSFTDQAPQVPGHESGSSGRSPERPPVQDDESSSSQQPGWPRRQRAAGAED